MSYRPIWDGTFMVANTEGDSTFYENLMAAVFSNKLMIVNWVKDGEAPEITIRGTRPQLEGFLMDYYDCGTHKAMSKADLWDVYVEECDPFVLVA